MLLAIRRARVVTGFGIRTMQPIGPLFLKLDVKSINGRLSDAGSETGASLDKFVDGNTEGFWLIPHI